MKKLFTTASLIALMAAFGALPAAAQTAAPPSAQTAPSVETTAPSVPSDKMMAASHTGQLSAKALLNENVKNAANKSVGDINDVLISSDGKIAAVIVGVGGFLGMGEKNVALPFTELMFAKNADDDLIVSTSATKESLQTAPEYKKPDDRS